MFLFDLLKARRNIEQVYFCSNLIQTELISASFLPQLASLSLDHRVGIWVTTPPYHPGTRTPQPLTTPPLQCTLRCRPPRSLTLKHLSHTSRWEESQSCANSASSELFAYTVCWLVMVMAERCVLAFLSCTCFSPCAHAKPFCLSKLCGNFKLPLRYNFWAFEEANLTKLRAVKKTL